MKKVYWVLFICGIFLLPTLFFPISCDISIYALGGQTFAESGTLYVNFLDLKFPAIFELYSILYKTIGISEFALRLFDFIVQILTCLCLYYIFSSRFKKPEAGAYASWIYALLYSSGGYGVTMQHDSFVGLVCCIAFILLSSKRTVSKLAVIGILAGFLFALKLTFIVVAFGIVIYILCEPDKSIKTRLSQSGVVGIASLLTFFLTLLPLLNSDSFSEWMSVTKYLGYYNSLMPFTAELIKESLKTIGATFGDYISLLITISAAYGIIISINGRYDEQKIENSGTYYFFLLGVLLFISIAVEKRFVYYHFYRIFIPLSLFAGFGLERLIQEFRSGFKKDYTTKASIVLLALFGIALSPAARFGNLAPPTVYYFVSPAKYEAYYERNNGITVYQTHKSVARFLDYNIRKDSLAMVIATGGNQINYLRKDRPHSKFSQSSFLMGTIVVPKWQNDFDSELHRAAALAVQIDDVHPCLTGFEGSSYKWLKRSEHWKYVNSHFKEVKRIGSFVLFRRDAV